MFSKALSKTIGSLVQQNKGQVGQINDILKDMTRVLNGGAATGPLKAAMADLAKSVKLIEAQSALFERIELPEADPRGDREQAALVKDLQDMLKRMTDENRRQTAEIEDLSKEVEEAAGGGGKDGTKKAKAAADALERARKLVDEQNRLLEEARKALAD